ncbi:hypothetical protein BAE44_0010485 [Dichanthelium oligosanthes]|uniref:Uncharacterized protein n=1 Tax=Dichanthelium oligosanthes TaxID=888268 RepID=A0A1E5VTS0_9POAL|nr:hypothetical protein BAE44_0010485 [Dichanthelium oligosanthes]
MSAWRWTCPGAAPHLCAGHIKAAETTSPVVAWGAAVRVPGFALGDLAEEMRRGDATFTVPSVSSGGDDARQGKLVRCMDRRVGDVSALRAACVVYAARSIRFHADSLG